MPGEYEDKYLLLRDENTALKKKKNEQEATIKRMYTKLAIIEEKMTKKRQTEGKDNQNDPESGGNTAVVPVRRDLDTEKFIAALKIENVTLRKKNQSLVEKNRRLEEQRRSKRVGGAAASTTPMQNRPTTRSTAARNESFAGNAKNESFAGNTLEKQAASARKLHRDTFSGDLEVAMKKRLVIAEKQLVKLQNENEQLRAGSSLLLKPRRDNNDESVLSDEEDADKDDNNKDPTSLEIEHLKRELRDRQAQLAILNARYENLESNALAEREIQEKTLRQMDQMNRQVHKLRTQLQDAVMEKEEMEIRITKVGDQEKDIVLLREQNYRLEERMTSLCESPFINDAFQRKERIDKLFDLEKLTHEQKTTIAHMTEENQKLQGIIRELQSSIKQLKQAKDRVEQDLEQMAHHLMEERNARSLEIIKSTAGGMPVSRPEPLVIVRPRTPEMRHQPPEKRDACSSPVHKNQSSPKPCAPSLHIAGGVVGRKYGDLPATASLFGVEEENSVKHLRTRVHVLQIAHLKSMQELERCEKMLQAQTNINRELALEIEELTTSKISSSNQLQRRMKDLELLCEDRQQRIHVLQAEIKQLKYAREKMLLKARQADDTLSDGSVSDEEGSDVASLSESLILTARDLAPGEQLLELGIMSGNFDSSIVGINSSTFVLCDFYDFESQSTPLLMGSHPEYNLSATFKVTVDGFFLRYLASESIVLEVHQAIRGDFKLIGKASVRLSKLLQSKGVVKESLLEVKSITSNDGGTAVLGSLNVVLRLSTPISEVWQVHLRSYPQDIQLLSEAGKRGEQEYPTDIFCDEDVIGNTNLSTNELQVTIFGCRNLRSYGKLSDGSASRIPSSYAHYQLLGFPDVFTNIVPESSSPEYDLGCCRQAFVLTVDACLLRFFSQCRLWITVFDDKAELADTAQEDGMVGKCGLLLLDLVSGENIRGWFPLKDQNNQHAGDISILIQWKDPFQVLRLTSSQRARGVNGRPVDMHSLDFDQQYALLAMFSSELDGQVNYRQFLHYAAPSEELELLVAKMKERFEYAIDSELVPSIQDALTAGSNTSQRKHMIIPMNTILKAGEKQGIFLTDSERGLLLATFGVASSSERRSIAGDAASGSIGHDELIALNYLLLHINPRLSCVERLLCHKIRQTVHGYVQKQRKRKAADNVPAPKLFEKFDEDRCGRVNRSVFRKCLSALGFDLMSIESEYRELIQNHTKQPSYEQNQSDLVANGTTSPGDIDLDEDVLEDVTSKASHQVKPSARLHREIETKARTTVNEVPVMDASELTLTSVPAATEFQRRKQAFMDRMKAIASASSKNLVYEQVEKKLLDHHNMQVQEQGGKSLSRQELLQQQLEQLQVPQNIHHDAAKTLQRQYRQYKEQQQQRREIDHVTTNIMEADIQMQRMLSKWTFADLNDLEESMLAEIERDVPEAKRTRQVTKKQLSYLLSKIPRIALPPHLLWQLMDFFSVKQSDMVSYRPLLKFICSTSTEESEREKNQRMSVLSRLRFNVGYAYHNFVSAGDMNETGVISFKKFHECLSRLGVQLSSRDLHLVTIMFDANGFEILYHSLLHSLTQLPHRQQLARTLDRCHRFGISTLRDKILTYVNTDDGRITREDLLRVLIQQSGESVHFEPQDAGLLFQMIAGSDENATHILIQEMCLRLETAEKYTRKSFSDDWNKYDMHYLQRLAWNCRKLICGSYSDLKYEFERFDWQERGFISLVEFVAITRQNGFALFTENQLKSIAKSFSVKTRGSFGINYRQFLDWTTPPLPADMDVIEEKLQTFAQTQADRVPSRQLSEIFTNWSHTFSAEAKSGTGTVLNRSHFVKICQTRLGLPLDENEMRTLLYTYDPQLTAQIDYVAVLRMNWRETINASQKRVKITNDLAKAKHIVEKLRKKFQDRKIIARDIAEAFSYTDDTNNQLVECGQFFQAMRKLGIVLSTDDVQTLFVAFAEQPENIKLDFVNFFKNSFNLVIIHTSNVKPDFRLSSENETRLKCALDAAVKFSLPKLQKSFLQFQEFCVVHHFREIALSKLRRQMDANGLVELLSKRGAGLLLQKFSSSSYDEDELECGSKLNVSLKGVHEYLKDFLNRANAKAQQGPIRPSVVPDAEPAPAPIARPTQPRTPITILSEFVNWCDEHGIDLRGEIESSDEGYTGFVTAMELKQTLLRLGIAKFAYPSTAETTIGQLVRQFRSAERTDAVQYTTLLVEAIQPVCIGPESRWYDQICEHLRSRVRLKANFSGTIDHSDPKIYLKLDAAFNHFDRDTNGFLTVESLQSGLRALQYELTKEQLSMLMAQMCIFRHGGGGLSRTEFDSFVLDPYGPCLLKTLSDQLYSEVKSHGQDTIPRVAYLSRLLMECGGLDHESSIPNDTFWTQLETALEKQMAGWEKLRLQHLFDVRRDGQIAYKLFLKVMSQWRTPGSVPPVSLRNNKATEQRPATKPKKPDQQVRIQEVAKLDHKPPCACDAILRSLYNQMSSIDFDSQVDIFEEYLRSKDRKRTGSIKMKQLKKLFDQIGLSLSADAFTSLQMYFPGITSSSAEEEQCELVAYEKLLLALGVLHEERSDRK